VIKSTLLADVKVKVFKPNTEDTPVVVPAVVSVAESDNDKALFIISLLEMLRDAVTVAIFYFF
jgi:hypothetical protein